MPASRRSLTLLTVCLAAFAINLDSTIVNVALPTIATKLAAGTRTLQWVVDGYNLAFAALVLTGGSIGDRFGRRPVLVIGLGGFAAASVVAAWSGGAGTLVALRFVMGACAALIFPTTLSIITNTYPEREARARAVGIWGAVTGAGVAVGPVCGGLLLAHFWWGSVFLALAPVAVVAAVMTLRLVPESSDPVAARIDPPGLALSSLAVGALVYTVISAPTRGWLSGGSIAGYLAAAGAVAVFVVVERGRAHPMIDVSLFKVPAFSAASAAVTVAFFSLFGFTFLVTQYMQFLRHWSALSTGVRILPVAASIAAGSAAGAALVARVGTRRVVVTGLVLLGASFAFIAAAPANQPYAEIAGEMLLMGLGLGLTTAPATESILSVLPPAKAGVGSAVNDATREAGGTLGVAVIGSLWSSLYGTQLGTRSPTLPAHALAAARGSLGYAMHLPGAGVHRSVVDAFMHGFDLSCAVVAVVCGVGALAALRLPGRRSAPAPAPASVGTVATPAPQSLGV